MIPHGRTVIPVKASDFDSYTNDNVKCKCGSNKRVVSHSHSIYYSLRFNDGYQQVSEICYDCGSSIDYEIKYIITADVRNIKIKNKGE